MKINALLSELGQSLGLRCINLLARLGAYEVSCDIAYAEQNRQRLDYYRLPGDAERPLVLFFYGGNWQSGRRQDYRFVADTLIQLGCDVVVPDYRLYPEVRFEQIIADASAATHWVLNNTPAHQPVFVMGHSAGAQIGALMCLNESLLDLPAAVRGRIKGFIGLAGPYDFFPFTEDPHWDLFGPEEHYPLSQAVNFVRADAPPMYLLHGSDDRRVRRGHSKSLMEKLQAVGGPAAREVYEGLGHVEIIVSFSRLHRQNNPVIRHIADFIRDPNSVMVRG
ncbi:MAG: alpha/beta hydrolase [Pseudomonadales bacterium]|nr:alpha/beta hydrolase [Pseudomonadales bacterium]